MSRREFGTIIQRKGSRRFYVRFFAGSGRNQRRYERPAGATREIAKAKLRQVDTLLSEGKTVLEVLQRVFGDPTPDCITFQDAITPYLEYAKRKRKASTFKAYAYLLNTVKKTPWTKQELDAITAADITRWLDALDRAGKAAQTVNNHHAIVSAVFRWAVKMGLAVANPAAAVDWEPQGKGRETYLNPEQARELVRALVPPLRSFVVCALLTGMRRGELQDLKWRAVDLKKGTLTVEFDTTKNSEPRTIRMERRLLAEMAKHHLATPKQLKKPAGLVFVHSNGRRLSETYIAKTLAAAVDASKSIPAGMKPKVTMHCLRHTAASQMVAGGTSIFDVSKVLGHKDVKTTMRYAHFQPKAGRAAAETLEKMLDLDREDPETDAVHDREVQDRTG